MANGWSHRVGDPEHFAALMRHSQRTAVAIADTEEIVGFARAITDGLSNGYLSMVAVAIEHCREGIGSALVSHGMADALDITEFMN